MANLNVTGNFSTSSNFLNVSYTTDAQNITNMEITRDNINFITADSFTSSNAVFDVSAWDNGNYTCKLRMTYTEATPGPTVEIVLYSISNITVNKGEAFNILYSTNIPAVKHEMSWDEGSSYSEIEVTSDGLSYTYEHEAINDTTWNPVSRYIRVTDSNGKTSTKSISITINEPVVSDPIELNLASSMTCTKGVAFNINYTTNVPAVKHEMSWDGGSSYTEVWPTNNGNNSYSFSHEAITDTTYNPVSRYIRVTDSNGKTSAKSISITITGSSIPSNPGSNLLDASGAYLLDDFAGTSLDRSKWDYEWGYVRNGELQNYQDTNAVVNNGILELQGRKDGNGKWTAASIISKGHFAFMYGKIECRAKIDPTWGSFSAFWTLGDSFEFGYHNWGSPDTLGEYWAWCGEFDVMEFYSGRLTCGTFFNEKEESGRVWYDNYDFNAWHTFAMEWLENGTLIFSIDGHELSRTNPTDNRAFHIPHFILINQAIGASGGTPADSTTAITQYVDWVKYYPANTDNLVLNSSDFYLSAMDFNDNSHNCMVRPIFNDNCINKSLTWSSSNSSLVWVHSGLCGTYAGANGTVNITATSHSGVSKQITLTVNDGVLRAQS